MAQACIGTDAEGHKMVIVAFEMNELGQLNCGDIVEVGSATLGLISLAFMAADTRTQFVSKMRNAGIVDDATMITGYGEL